MIILNLYSNIRKKDVSKYHIQLSIALLLMLIVALAFVILSAEGIETLYGGCAFLSFLVHYFALVSVVWMAAEALLMFQKLVIVFVQITTKYIIIVSVLCWSKSIIDIYMHCNPFLWLAI